MGVENVGMCVCVGVCACIYTVVVKAFIGVCSIEEFPCCFG